MCPPTLISGGHLQNLGDTQKQYNFNLFNFNLCIVSCPLLISKVSGLALSHIYPGRDHLYKCS